MYRDRVRYGTSYEWCTVPRGDRKSLKTKRPWLITKVRVIRGGEGRRIFVDPRSLHGGSPFARNDESINTLQLRVFAISIFPDATDQSKIRYLEYYRFTIRPISRVSRRVKLDSHWRTNHVTLELRSRHTIVYSTQPRRTQFRRMQLIGNVFSGRRGRASRQSSWPFPFER